MNKMGPGDRSSGAQKIDTLTEHQYNRPLMVYLPAHGGWHRAIVKPPVTDGGGIPVSHIKVSAALPLQVSMHQGLTTAFATHWRELPEAPFGSNEVEQNHAFAAMAHFCAHNNIVMHRHDGKMKFLHNVGTSERLANLEVDGSALPQSMHRQVVKWATLAGKKPTA